MKKVKTPTSKARRKPTSHIEAQVVDTFVTSAGATGTLYANGSYQLDAKPSANVGVDDPFLFELSPPTGLETEVSAATAQTTANETLSHQQDDAIVYGADSLDAPDNDIAQALVEPNWMGDMETGLGVTLNPYSVLAAETHKDMPAHHQEMIHQAPSQTSDDAADYAPVATPTTDDLWLEMTGDKPILILSDEPDDGTFSTDK